MHLGKIWKKDEIKKLTKEITGFDVKIKFVSFKSLDNYTAMAYSYTADPTDPSCSEYLIEFAARKFRENLIWHECAHLLFPDWWNDHTTKEVECHINAVHMALDKNRIDIANELIEATLDWKIEPHKKAGKIIRKYFKFN